MPALRTNTFSYVAISFLAFSNFSFAQMSTTPVESAFNLCSASTKLDSEFTDALIKMGWTPAPIPWTEKQKSVFEDGAMAAMTSFHERAFNWPLAVFNTKKLSDAIGNSQRVGGNKIFAWAETKEAVLVIAERPHFKYQIVHCIYSGPSDDKFRGTIAAAKAANDRQGQNYGTNEVDVAVLETQSQTNSNPRKATAISAKMGIYVSEMTSVLKRQRNADAGFSLFKYTAK